MKSVTPHSPVTNKGLHCDFCSFRALEHGVAIVEFTVAFLALMLFTIGMIDMTRLFTVEMLLNRAAEEAVHHARKLANIDNDFRNKPPADHLYYWYTQSRRRVMMKAMRIPLSTWFTDINTPSSIQLMPMTYVDDSLDLGGLPPPISTFGAALLRPGDRVWLGNPAAIGDLSQGKWIEHKRFPYMPDIDRPQKVLQKYHPLYVELVAEVDMIFPGLGKKRVHGRALGYREPWIPPTRLPPIAGEIVVLESTTTTTTTSSTTPRSSTTTTTWGCGVNWSGHFHSSSDWPGAPRCPVPGGTGWCGDAFCSTALPAVSH